MSLFGRLVRRPGGIEDPRVVRLLESLSDDLTPRPEFRDRLRGSVLAAHRAGVAGSGTARIRPARLVVRAALVACIALGATVGSVLGASQAAVPGDLLYPVKLEVEALRLRVAPPHIQPALARAIFAERIDELGTLVDRGEWDLASAMAAPIEGALSRIQALDVDLADLDRGLETQLSRLATLLPTLPANGASAVTEALGDAVVLLDERTGGDDVPPSGDGNNGNGSGSDNGNTGNGQGTNNGSGNGNGSDNGNTNNGNGFDNGNTGNGQGTNNGNGNGDGSDNGNTGNGQGTNNGNGSDNGNTGNGQGTNNGNGSENGNTGNGQGTNNGNGNGPKASASPTP